MITDSFAQCSDVFSLRVETRLKTKAFEKNRFEMLASTAAGIPGSDLNEVFS